MSDKIVIKVEPSEVDQLRDRCAKIAAIEAHYWAAVAMRAILEDSGIDPNLLTDPGDVA